MSADREGEPDTEEPVVDSDAVELPADAAPASAARVPLPPLPPLPDTAYPEPVASTTPAVPPPAAAPPPPPLPLPPVASVAPPAVPGSPPPVASGTASAGSGASASEGLSPDQVMDNIKALASERPELAVGAAFAGGILAAMILRRLGN